ncbi:leucine Rich repeat-containing domain protein, partial [Oesophagostomum dentatum]
MHRWSRHKCLLYNGCLRIQKGISETGEDDVINLSRCRVDICETRRGRCLRLQTSTSVIVLRFDDQETLSLWSTRCRQSGNRHICDLSDRKLTLLPETLLSANPEDIQQLNLRRNSLLGKNSSNASGAQIGWLDDLNRFTSLTSLDLSSNRLSTFPVSITQLTNLQKLNLASNCIQTIPSNVKLLK